MGHARALTAPMAPAQPMLDLARSSTNIPTGFVRDRHAVPPSILAQNRELLGIAERPRASCNEQHHTSSCSFDSDSSSSGHVEGIVGTVLAFAQPRRQSTLTRLTETARNTTTVAKRRLSKVITWRRKDSKGDDDPTPPNKAPRMGFGGGESQVRESSAALLGHGQQSPMSEEGRWEDAVDLPSPPNLPDHLLQPPPHDPFRTSLTLERSIANALAVGAVPTPTLQDRVEIWSQRARRSPDELPHEYLMQDPESWAEAEEKLRTHSRDPRLVGRRFDKIYGDLTG